MKRTTGLPEVPAEKFGIRVLVRERPDNRGGNLELVACIPIVKNGVRKVKRNRCSARTSDPVTAYRRAEALAQQLSLRIKGLVRDRIQSRFFAGGDVTDLDCLDYYEAEVLPRLGSPGSEYRQFATSKIKILRKLLPLVAADGTETPLRLIDQNYVNDLKRQRLKHGALRKDGSGEWRVYRRIDDDAELGMAAEDATEQGDMGFEEEEADSDASEPLDPNERKVRLSTVASDIRMLRRAINAARAYQVRDGEGRWLSIVQYDPFQDGTKRIKLPLETDVQRQPIMDYEEYGALLAAANSWDQHVNQEYARLKYAGRYPHHRPRCTFYTEALLTVARQGRRRQDLPPLRWRHVVFPEDARRMAEVIQSVLGIKITAARAREMFPYGLLIWSRRKTDVYRFIPMSSTLCECLRRFREAHPHRDRPAGPLFYSARDYRKAVTEKTLADWFPRLQQWAGIPHGDEEGWHMFRRLFRQERQGHLSNKIVAYCGGWSRLERISQLLDVDDNEAMNRHYLQVLLRQMYACMAFDASKLDPELHIAGVSEHVLAQLREEGYLGTGESAAPLDVRPS